MTISVNGTTGVSLVQDSSITTAKLVAAAVTPDKLSGGQSGSAPVFGCRAWCNFDGTLTGTNAPRAGGNVTSVTRNAVGDYTINFTTAMQDISFSTTVTCAEDYSANTTGSAVATKSRAAPVVGSVRVVTLASGSGARLDCIEVSAAIFR